MSDVGLSAELDLDIRRAQEQVARLERAMATAAHIVVTADTAQLTRAITAGVDAADTAVTVTGEATELTGSVTAAVDAADTAVVVTGEATELTGDVTAAVDAGDSEVVVTGDASELTGDVTKAVDAGDSHVVITADSFQLKQAASAADELGGSLGAAAGHAGKLGSLLAGVGIAAVAKGLFEAAQAASNLSEATSKASTVFGDGIGQVQAFARAADTGLGLSESAALEATGTFGNLFNALGLTKDAATELAPQVVTLASDFASFNNLNLDETLEKLRSGLVGEIEPLRSLGVSFGAAEVEAKAMELGLAGVNGEVDEGAKIQARWALILEQSKNAQGDFARTADGLANQQRILTAEFQNAVIVVGKELEPALLDLIGTSRGALPGLQDLAVEGIGALVTVVNALAPALGTGTSLLVALAPVINLVAGAVDALPDPLLQAIAAFLLMRKLGGPLSSVLDKVAFSLFDVAGKADRMGGGLSVLQARAVAGSVALVGLSLAFAAWSSEQAQASASARAVEGQIGNLSVTFQGTGKSAELYAESLRKAVEQNEDLEVSGGKTGATITDLGKLLEGAGLTLDQFVELTAKGGSALEDFLGPLEESGLRGNLTAEALKELAVQMQEGADRAIAAGLATETWTQEQVDAAVAANTAKDGTVNYAAALDTLKAGIVEATNVEAGMRASMELTRQTLTDLAESAPAVGTALGAITRDGATNAEFVALAGAIDAASLSEEQLGAIAQTLGVPLSALKANVEGVTASVQSFVAGVEGSLPNIAQNLSALGEGVTLQGIRDEFAKTLQDMVAFEANLAALAAFPNVQAAAAAAGPQVAAALAQGVKDGKTSVLAEMELMAVGTAQTEQRIIDQANGVWAPNFAAAQANAGRGGTSSFVRSFLLAPHTTAQGQAARNIMQAKGRELDGAARGAGSQASAGFKAGVAPIPGHAEKAAQGARDAVGRNAYGSGHSAGSSLGEGFAAGVGAWAGAAADKAAQLVFSAKAAANAAARNRSPSKVFMEIGGDIGAGLAIGIEQQAARVAAATVKLVTAAKPTDLQRAAAELEAAIRRGVRVNEDFSFKGMSANLRRWNDDLAKLAFAQNRVNDFWRDSSAVIRTLDQVQARSPAIARLAAIPANRIDADARAQTVNVQPGAVVIQLPPGLSPAEQRRVLNEGSSAFWGTLQDRRVTAGARAQ